MTKKEELFASLDYLVDQWCERRELGKLGRILQAYPMVSVPLTDSWGLLYDALRVIRSTGYKDLPEIEQEKLGAAIVTIGRMLYPNDFYGSE